MSLKQELSKAYNKAKKNKSIGYFAESEAKVMEAAQSGLDHCFVTDFPIVVICDFCKANNLHHMYDDYGYKIYGWS